MKTNSTAPRNYKTSMLICTALIFIAVAFWLRFSLMGLSLRNAFQTGLLISATRMTDDQLGMFFRVPVAAVKGWTACEKAYKEYYARTTQWRKILDNILVNGFEESYSKIDFSLPNDLHSKPNVSNQFFNPSGFFSAMPIPQDVLDELTTVKGTQVIFNTRLWLTDKSSSHSDHLFRGPQVGLVAILPNLNQRCDVIKHAMGTWNGGLSKGAFTNAPDNHSVVYESDEPSGLRYGTSSNENFLVTVLSSRNP